MARCRRRMRRWGGIAVAMGAARWRAGRRNKRAVMVVEGGRMSISYPTQERSGHRFGWGHHGGLVMPMQEHGWDRTGRSGWERHHFLYCLLGSNPMLRGKEGYFFHALDFRFRWQQLQYCTKELWTFVLVRIFLKDSTNGINVASQNLIEDVSFWKDLKLCCEDYTHWHLLPPQTKALCCICITDTSPIAWYGHKATASDAIAKDLIFSFFTSAVLSVVWSHWVGWAGLRLIFY
jgi:hypothetical protein